MGRGLPLPSGASLSGETRMRRPAPSEGGLCKALTPGCPVPSTAAARGDCVNAGMGDALLGLLHHNFCRYFGKLLPEGLIIKDQPS